MMIRIFLLTTVVSLHTTHAALQNDRKGSTSYQSPTLQLNQTSDFFSKVENNQIEEVQKLLESGIDPNIQDKYTQTALHVTQTPKMVKLLISFGANPNKVDQSQQTPLHTINYADVACALLDARACPKKISKYGNTVLFNVPEMQGGATLIKRLIDAGVNINHQRTIDKFTALHVAVWYFFLNFHRREESFKKYPRPQEILEIIETLIQNGASLTIKNDDEKTPFDLANTKHNENLLYPTRLNEINMPLINKALALLKPQPTCVFVSYKSVT